jgi:hypothetical protein
MRQIFPECSYDTDRYSLRAQGLSISPALRGRSHTCSLLELIRSDSNSLPLRSSNPEYPERKCLFRRGSLFTSKYPPRPGVTRRRDGFLCFAHLACLSVPIAAPSTKPKPKSLLNLTKTASSSREGGLGKVIFGLPRTGESLKTRREKR